MILLVSAPHGASGFSYEHKNHPALQIQTHKKQIKSKKNTKKNKKKQSNISARENLKQLYCSKHVVLGSAPTALRQHLNTDQPGFCQSEDLLIISRHPQPDSSQTQTAQYHI